MFVRPLAAALRRMGVSVWYDEFTLRLGDSLSKSIDRGLANSNYGLVVISRNFIAKRWTEYELRGLVLREIHEGRLILPIWHGITQKEILDFSPPLADKVALITAGHSAEDIAIMLLREIRPDLYSKHKRSELEKMASGETLDELQAELDQMREELMEYRCPYCQASVVDRFSVPVDPEEKDFDTREEFECGFVRIGNFIKRPCPDDPRFPKFEDFELSFRNNSDEEMKWICYARGRTDMARRLSLNFGIGCTKEEAENQIRDQYNHIARKAIRNS